MDKPQGKTESAYRNWRWQRLFRHARNVQTGEPLDDDGEPGHPFWDFEFGRYTPRGCLWVLAFLVPIFLIFHFFPQDASRLEYYPLLYVSDRSFVVSGDRFVARADGYGYLLFTDATGGFAIGYRGEHEMFRISIKNLSDYKNGPGNRFVRAQSWFSRLPHYYGDRDSATAAFLKKLGADSVIVRVYGSRFQKQ